MAKISRNADRLNRCWALSRLQLRKDSANIVPGLGLSAVRRTARTARPTLVGPIINTTFCGFRRQYVTSDIKNQLSFQTQTG